MGATLLYLWTTSRSTPTRSWGEFWSFINTSWNCDYHEIVMIMVTSTWRTVLMIMWFQFWWTRQYERYLQTSHLLDLGWKVSEMLVDFFFFKLTVWTRGFRTELNWTGKREKGWSGQLWGWWWRREAATLWSRGHVLWCGSSLKLDRAWGSKQFIFLNIFFVKGGVQKIKMEI